MMIYLAWIMMNIEDELKHAGKNIENIMQF
jgi:hypothetical protein